MKLSVIVITYNHERFIRQSLDSVLMQKTDFEYEVVIGEDCSTDRTREIAAEYENTYPGRIRLLPADRNIGANRNLDRSLDACRGEYVALVDGDDYWTAPDKLQTQVDFLERHPECSMCFHDVENVFEGERLPPVYVPIERNEILTIEDLLEVNFIPTPSVVFRRSALGEFPEWFLDLPFGDWPLFILLAEAGYVGYIARTMGAYRRHSQAATSGDLWSSPRAETFRLAEVEMYQRFSRRLSGRYRQTIATGVSLRYYMLAAQFEKSGDLSKARSYALRRLAMMPFDRQSEQPLKHLIRLYMPAQLYQAVRFCKRSVQGK